MSIERDAGSLILAYADEISRRAGQSVRFAVSCRGAAAYIASVVRLFSPAAGKAAPAYREQVMPTALDGPHPAEWQPIDAGSWAHAPAAAGYEAGATLQAFIWPTLLDGRPRYLLGTWNERTRRGIALRIDEQGRLQAIVGDRDGHGERVSTVTAARPLLTRHWLLVAATYDAASGRLQLLQVPVDNGLQSTAVLQVDEASCPGHRLSGEDGISFAAMPHAPGRPGRRAPALVRDHYDGKLDRPRLAARALSLAEIVALAEPGAGASVRGIVGAWDFSQAMGSETIVDASGRGHHGQLFNMPARAATGANWRAQEMNWRHAPQLYGAIHFHGDDLHDCGWTFQHTLALQGPGWDSGIYALKLSCPGAPDHHVPFYINVTPGQEAPRIAFLASTATFAVYSNLKARLLRDFWEVSQGRLIQMDRLDIALIDHPELGLSTYDRHADGSGVSYVSRLRPSTTVRPDGRMWNFPADLLCVDWLEQVGLPYGVVCDDQLHEDGVAALSGCEVLVTGSHPEYFSGAMLKAVEAFLKRGGRLMYLGGNGFYWKIAYHPQARGVIELRRAEDGLRAWDAEPGEYYHSSDGEYGGLWRRNGTPPQLLTGVGFVAQGFDASSPYRRLPASHDPRARFIFEGVRGEVFGDRGLMGGGAAGMEIDAADALLGTPAHALVLARSEGHSNAYEAVNEEITIAHSANNVLHNPRVRAEMVFFETAAGGAVFCTGSIAYAGALSVDHYDNDCARIATNVLRRFADPAPFSPEDPE